MLVETLLTTFLFLLQIQAEANGESKQVEAESALEFTLYGPLAPFNDIGSSACDDNLERECPKWKLHCKVEKWVPVNMKQYTGKDNSINAQIYFARPEECHSFLERGLLSVTEFIRHHNTLAYNGLWSWTDPNVEKVLQTTVGRKFFNYMGNLNMDNLNEMVAADLTKTEKYLDYPTECELRRLLAREQDHGEQGKDAREQLRNYREFHSGWENTLFRNMTLETENSGRVDTAATSSNSTQTAKATSAASYFNLDRFWWSLSGILLLML